MPESNLLGQVPYIATDTDSVSSRIQRQTRHVYERHHQYKRMAEKLSRGGTRQVYDCGPAVLDGDNLCLILCRRLLFLQHFLVNGADNGI